MSIFSNPVVADFLAGTMNHLSYAFTRRELRFEEIPGRRSEIAIPTRHGSVRCIKYLPPATDERPAVYVNFHGGGFTFRDPDQDDPMCRYLAARAEVVVLNIDYDVAPRHRFPVPVEEAFDVVSWASADGDEWDGGRLCVGGQSAGGNLTAAVARLSLKHGGPPIALQVLHYAPLDLVTTNKRRPPGAGLQVVPPWMATVFGRSYVPDPAMRRDPLVSPVWGDNARGLEGIAPALVITAQYDMLHDEGVAYADALRRAGALVEHLDVAGAGHAYNILTGTRQQAQHTYDVMAGHVRRAVGQSPAGN